MKLYSYLWYISNQRFVLPRSWWGIRHSDWILSVFLFVELRYWIVAMSCLNPVLTTLFLVWEKVLDILYAIAPERSIMTQKTLFGMKYWKEWPTLIQTRILPTKSKVIKQLLACVDKIFEASHIPPPWTYSIVAINKSSLLNSTFGIALAIQWDCFIMGKTSVQKSLWLT